MTPPPTSIDGTGISGATIDGQEVQEITVDGQTVFEAIPPGAFELDNYTLQKRAGQVNGSRPNTTHLAFSNDGSRLFELKRRSSIIVQVGLSTPFDIGSKSIEKETRIIQEGNKPKSPRFNSDGTRLYIADDSEDEIIQFNLSSPFDIGSVSRGGSFRPPGSRPDSIDLLSDGTRLYLYDSSSGGSLFQFSLSTPFDIRTASLQKEVDLFDFDFTGIRVELDGTRLFVVRGDGTFSDPREARLEQYNVSTPGDMATATLAKTRDTIRDNTTHAFSAKGSFLYTLDNPDIVQHQL